MKDNNYKTVDGNFYLRELQSNGTMEWIQIKANSGNKNKMSSHGDNRSNRLGR
jgi:hypothetical protein